MTTWKLKLQLISKCRKIKTYADVVDLKYFVSENLEHLDSQGLGIVIRAINIDSEPIKRDLTFLGKLTGRIKTIDPDDFTKSELLKIKTLNTYATI